MHNMSTLKFINMHGCFLSVLKLDSAVPLSYSMYIKMLLKRARGEHLKYFILCFKKVSHSNFGLT